MISGKLSQLVCLVLALMGISTTSRYSNESQKTFILEIGGISISETCFGQLKYIQASQRLNPNITIFDVSQFFCMEDVSQLVNLLEAEEFPANEFPVPCDDPLAFFSGYKNIIKFAIFSADIGLQERIAKRVFGILNPDTRRTFLRMLSEIKNSDDESRSFLDVLFRAQATLATDLGSKERLLFLSTFNYLMPADAELITRLLRDNTFTGCKIYSTYFEWFSDDISVFFGNNFASDQWKLDFDEENQHFIIAKYLNQNLSQDVQANVDRILSQKSIPDLNPFWLARFGNGNEDLTFFHLIMKMQNGERLDSIPRFVAVACVDLALTKFFRDIQLPHKLVEFFSQSREVESEEDFFYLYAVFLKHGILTKSEELVAFAFDNWIRLAEESKSVPKIIVLALVFAIENIASFILIERIFEFCPKEIVVWNKVLNLCVTKKRIGVIKFLLSKFSFDSASLLGAFIASFQDEDINALIIDQAEKQGSPFNFTDLLCKFLRLSTQEYQRANNLKLANHILNNFAVDWTFLTQEKLSFLHVGAESGDSDLLGRIMSKVDPSLLQSVDESGNTPLLIAIFSPFGNIDCVRVLVEAGADIYKTNIYGASAITLAEKSRNKEIFRWLKEQADPKQSSYEHSYEASFDTIPRHGNQMEE